MAKRMPWVVAGIIAVAVLGALVWRQQGWGARPAPKVDVVQTPPPPPVTAPPVTTTPPPTPTPEPACRAGQAADYFPYHLTTQATYAGLGNEYASYSLKVIAAASGKVEWRKNNGGTVMAEVYQVAPQHVTLVYREGEAYDNTPRINQPANQSQIILKGPIQVGTQWVAGNATSTIKSVDASVQAMNQTLTCVIMVETQSPDSLIQTYFHRQYGIVLSVFNPTSTPIESRLATFTP